MTLSAPLESSLLRLYAALPIPRSAVCLNHDGSLAPKDAAICSLDGSASSFCGERGLSPLTLPNPESGLLGLPPAPLLCGLCCHFTVPPRDGIAALGDGFAASGAFVSAIVFAGPGEEGALGLLIEPKPLNSGTPSAILLGERGEEGVIGLGEPACAVVLLGVCGLVGLSSARSADTGVCGVVNSCCSFAATDLACSSMSSALRFTPAFKPNALRDEINRRYTHLLCA